MNNPDGVFSGSMFLDVGIGLMLNVCTVFFGFVSFAQIETALLLGALSGLSGVLAGVCLRKILRIFSTWTWRRQSKKEAYIAELEAEITRLKRPNPKGEK
jgi:hypothetical protein